MPTGKLEDEAMSIKLARTEGTSYGLAYRVVEKALAEAGYHIIITGVLPNGAADVWNRSCENALTICAGDIIEQVNSIEVAKDIIMEMRDNNACLMKILKTGPRWHLIAEHYHQKAKALVFSTPDEEVEEEFPAYTIGHWFLFFCIAFVPCLCVVALFSEVGSGLKVYGMLASSLVDRGGKAIIAFSLMCCLALYILDWRLWESKNMKLGTLGCLAYMLCGGIILMARSYPQTPVVVFLVHIPVLLGVVRSTIGHKRSRSGFYYVAATNLFIVGFLVLGLWLAWVFLPGFGGDNTWSAETQLRLAEDSRPIYEAWNLTYIDDCYPKRNKLNDAMLSMAEKEKRTKECAGIVTTWFLAYSSPKIAGASCIVIASFCLMTGVWLKGQHSTKLEKMMKMFLLLSTVIIFGMYTVSSIAGASMRMSNTLIAFLGSALICLFVWFYIEIGEKAISNVVRSSKLMQSLILIAMSDWCRALFILVFGPALPCFFILNAMNQSVRRMRGITTSAARYTEGTQKVVSHLENWNWVSILSKVCLWGELFFTLQVGVSKLTYVFLSWLNEMLMEISLIAVIAIFTFMGLLMFLLPPVPGIPVYVTSGMIVATKAANDGMGLGVGCLIAVATSFVLKLLACCGQYSIGMALGKSIYIQKLVGVDKVPIRAVEKILKVPGLSPSKVAILVGGPDWPTSVLCGILKLNLGQILWGTCPVIFVSSPCVLAGAFLASGSALCASEIPPGEEEDSQGTFASTFMIIAGLGQLGSAVLAMYYMSETVQTHGDELAKPRKEHEPIEELTRQKEHYVRCYNDVTEWAVLDKSRKPILVASSVMMVLSVDVFILLDNYCFREFEVSSRIRCSFEDGGLRHPSEPHGSVLNLIYVPFGFLALLLFFTACVLHIAFLRWAQNESQAMLLSEVKASMDSSNETEESSDDEVDALVADQIAEED